MSTQVDESQLLPESLRDFGDLKLIADPVFVEPPPVVARLNRALADRFGLNPYGKPFFRLVDGRRELVVFQGRWTMRYPRFDDWREEWTCYVKTPDGLLPVPSPNAIDWPADLLPHAGCLVLMDRLRLQRGTPFWVMEGWVTGDRAGANWDEAIDGPLPENGDWRPLWACTDNNGGYRDPCDADLDEIARRISVLSESEVDRDTRWTDEFDQTKYRHRTEVRLRMEAENARQKSIERRAELEREIRDRIQTARRVTA